MFWQVVAAGATSETNRNKRQREAEAELGDDGRVLLRYSGTENLCRVMVEGPADEQVERLADKIADAVRQEIGA